MTEILFVEVTTSRMEMRACEIAERNYAQGRRLQIIAVDEKQMYLISGNGDVIEPDEEIIGIGSGGVAAQAAAAALIQHTELRARGIVEEAMKIAASLCVYTNARIIIEEL